MGSTLLAASFQSPLHELRSVLHREQPTPHNARPFPKNRGEAGGPTGRLPVWSLSGSHPRQCYVRVRSQEDRSSTPFAYRNAGTYPHLNLQLPPRSCPSLKLPAGPLRDGFVRPRRPAGPVSLDRWDWVEAEPQLEHRRRSLAMVRGSSQRRGPRGEAASGIQQPSRYACTFPLTPSSSSSSSLLLLFSRDKLDLNQNFLDRI